MCVNNLPRVACTSAGAEVNPSRALSNNTQRLNSILPEPQSTRTGISHANYCGCPRYVADTADANYLPQLSYTWLTALLLSELGQTLCLNPQT